MVDRCCPICLSCIDNDHETDGDDEGRGADEIRDDEIRAPACLGSAVHLPCRHTFHSGCLTTWFSSSSTCPVCRFDVNLNTIGMMHASLVPLPVESIERPSSGHREGDVPHDGDVRQDTATLEQVIRRGLRWLRVAAETHDEDHWRSYYPERTRDDGQGRGGDLRGDERGGRSDRVSEALDGAVKWMIATTAYCVCCFVVISTCF